MITYAEYVHFRDRKGYKDSDVARLAGFPQATLSEWKRGTYTPKYEKMKKIEQVLGIVSLYTEDNYIVLPEEHSPAAPAPLRKDESELLDLYNSMNPAGMKELMKMAKLFSGSDEYRLKGDDSESLKAEA